MLFFHGSRPVEQMRQIKKISYICLSEKNFGKPQLTVELGDKDLRLQLFQFTLDIY